MPARRRTSPAARGHHSVYVVYLRNPKGDGKAGYYVGMTGLTPEQRLATLLRAVDGLDAEVVERRAIERDDDRGEADAVGDRGSECREQGVEIPLAAHEPGDLEQARQPRDGVLD